MERLQVLLCREDAHGKVDRFRYFADNGKIVQENTGLEFDLKNLVTANKYGEYKYYWLVTDLLTGETGHVVSREKTVYDRGTDRIGPMYKITEVIKLYDPKETTDVDVTVIWPENDGNLRPKSINEFAAMIDSLPIRWVDAHSEEGTIHVSNTTAGDAPYMEMETKGPNEWVIHVRKLPKYDQDGFEYSYTSLDHIRIIEKPYIAKDGSDNFTVIMLLKNQRIELPLTIEFRDGAENDGTYHTRTAVIETLRNTLRFVEPAGASLEIKSIENNGKDWIIVVDEFPDNSVAKDRVLTVFADPADPSQPRESDGYQLTSTGKATYAASDRDYNFTYTSPFVLTMMTTANVEVLWVNDTESDRPDIVDIDLLSGDHIYIAKTDAMAEDPNIWAKEGVSLPLFNESHV